MTLPESHVYLCAVCLLVPLGECTPEGRMESRGRKVVERVGVGCIVLILMKGPRDPQFIPVTSQLSSAPRSQQHEDFYPFGIAELSFALL